MADNVLRLPGRPITDRLFTEAEFWKARKELEHIEQFAHSRMCSRWAVLGAVLTRVVCTVPPDVVLPPIIGSPVALNLFTVLVGGSGTGKSGATAVAGECVKTDGFDVAPIGSGEGIAKSYASSDKDGELVWHRRSVLFTAAEIDQLDALNHRSGSTLGPTIRLMYTGESVGFAYATREKKVILPALSYRAGLIVGAQPGRAGAILDDVDGGTPQRFLWMPGTDPFIPRHPGPTPDRRNLPDMQWRKDQGQPFTPMIVCDEAADVIRDTHYQKMTGTVRADPLDGHSLLTQLKVAAALGVLGGRKNVSTEDWALARAVQQVSDRTRAAAVAELAAGRDRVEEQQGRLAGVRQATAESAKEQYQIDRVTNLLLKKMSGSDPDGNPWTKSALRRKFADRDRHRFDEAVAEQYPNGSFEDFARRACP